MLPRVLLLALCAARVCIGLKVTVVGGTGFVGSRVCKTLVEKGAEVNVTDTKGRTELMWASCKGHLAVVEALLAAGADVNARSHDGLTALMLVTRRGNAAVVRALLATPGIEVAEGQRDGILEVLRKADDALVDEAIRKAAA